MEQTRETSVKRISHLLLFAILAAGVVVRLTALGRWPLAEDEYYLFRSIQNLLAHGIPAFDCGGYYVRGVLQQYLTAPVVLMAGDPEWAMRILPVFFNLLGAPAVYLLGRRLGGYPVACAATALFALSVWEIEFARFARMYAPFQTLFLWQLVLLLRTLVDRKPGALLGMYGLAAVGLFVYEGAIFLILLHFLPFILGQRRLTPGHLAANLGLTAAAVLLLKIDFRRLGVDSWLPEGIGGAILDSDGGGLPITPPPLLFTTLPEALPWLAAAALPLGMILWGLWRLWNSAGRDLPLKERLVWTLVLIASFLNLFGLAAEIFLLGYLFGLAGAGCAANRQEHLPPAIRPAVAAGIACLVFWGAYGLGSDSWLLAYGREGLSQVHQLVGILFKYPDFYYRIVVMWFEAMPVVTALLVVLLAALTIDLLARPQQRAAVHYLAGAVIMLIMVVAVLQTSLVSTRYSFFLYPALLLLCCTALARLAARLCSAGEHRRILFLYGAVLVFALVGEDFSFRHLSHIGSAEVNFRTDYSFARQGQLYRRLDYVTPAVYINEHMGEEDLVVSSVPVIDYYLNRLDYRFVNSEKSVQFPIISACGGRRELWSNKPMVYRQQDLVSLIQESTRPVWLVLFTDRPYRPKEERLLETAYEGTKVYTSMDGTVQVFHIPPDAPDKKMNGGTAGKGQIAVLPEK